MALYVFTSLVVLTMAGLVIVLLVWLPADPADAVILMYSGVLIGLGGLLAIAIKALAGTVENDWQRNNNSA